MTTLRQFLNARRATTNFTHLSVAPGGKYSVTNADLPDLYRIIAAETGPKHVLETHADLTAGPLLIDLDFEYPEEPRFHTRQYKADEIDKFIECIHEAVTYFYGPLDDVEYVVSEKPSPTVETGKRVKDGLHVVGRNLILSYKDQLQLRLYALEKHFLQSSFDTVHVKNEMSSVYDIAVIERNAWYLLGCSKPDRAPYLPTRSYRLADGSLRCRSVGHLDYSIADMSIRCGGTPRDLRAETAADWPGNVVVLTKARGKGRGKAAKEGKAVSEPTLSHVDEAGSVITHKSEGISKLLKLDGMDWEIAEMDDGFKLTHNSHRCLVADEATHGAIGHSCVFVQKTRANVFCFSHKTKPLSKALSAALWQLVCPAGRADPNEMIYAKRKAEFEKGAFRVLNPPGYMVFIEDGWVHYTRQQLIDMNSGIFLDSGKEERFIDWWLRDEHIRTYNRIGYFVDVAECPPSVFNTFAGFAAQRIVEETGDVSKVLWHIRHILANGREDVYDFIMDMLASCVQCPRRLIGICLVVMGQHGSGKDILFNWFGSKVIGMEAYFKTARPHIDMFGTFNSSRLNRVFYHIEEGNAKSLNGEAIEQFKNFITDEFASIQLKGVNTASNVTNYNHFVISTNNAVPFEIHTDERRFFAVKASAAKVRDNGYFTELGDCLRLPGVARGFYETLMARDLSGRDWKNPPVTEAMTEWKHSCESDLVQFVEHYRTVHPEVAEIKSSELYTEYRCYCREFHREPLKLRQFGMEMKKVVGESVHTRIGSVYNFISHS